MFRSFVVGPVGSVIAFVPLLVINLLQTLSVPVALVSRPLFRRLNTGFAGWIWTYWTHLLGGLIGCDVRFTGDAMKTHENAIVIANHQSMADIVVLIFAAKRVDMVGHMKWLVKDVVKYVPGVGWGMLFLDCIFLKRNWAKDEKSVRETFGRVVKNKLPVWLVSFPEGTRATAPKLERSRRYALNKGLVPTEHVMIPRTKGFTASFAGMREHVTAVYSFTIRYHDPKHEVWDLLCGRVKRVSVHVKRLGVETFPTDEAGLAAWLGEEFREKDRTFKSLDWS